jgi:hypothetical protein
MNQNKDINSNRNQKTEKEIKETYQKEKEKEKRNNEKCSNQRGKRMLQGTIDSCKIAVYTAHANLKLT